MNFDPQQIFGFIAEGDASSVQKLLVRYPSLTHIRNTDEEDWQASSPLHAASKHGHLDTVKLLVERGAEVYSNPMSTYPPVIIASWNKHQPVVDYFLQEIPDKAEGTNKLGVAINLAARSGWADIVRKHIEADPLSVHQRGWIGDTPLHWPSHQGYVAIVEMLLDAGADIEADEINCYGGKPLHWASEHEPAAVELLLKRGAEVDSRNIKADSESYGMTPLIMNASQRDDCHAVTELLVQAGADVNAIDANGKKALDHAVEKGCSRIADVLKRYGAEG